MLPTRRKRIGACFSTTACCSSSRFAFHALRARLRRLGRGATPRHGVAAAPIEPEIPYAVGRRNQRWQRWNRFVLVLVVVTRSRRIEKKGTRKENDCSDYE